MNLTLSRPVTPIMHATREFQITVLIRRPRVISGASASTGINPTQGWSITNELCGEWDPLGRTSY